MVAWMPVLVGVAEVGFKGLHQPLILPLVFKALMSFWRRSINIFRHIHLKLLNILVFRLRRSSIISDGVRLGSSLLQFLNSFVLILQQMMNILKLLQTKFLRRSQLLLPLFLDILGLTDRIVDIITFVNVYQAKL